MNGVPVGKSNPNKKCVAVLQETGSRRVSMHLAGKNENQAKTDAIASTDIYPGSTVVTDSGSAFNHIEQVVGGEHHKANHSKTEVVNAEGYHTESVESRNKQLKEWCMLVVDAAFHILMMYCWII